MARSARRRRARPRPERFSLAAAPSNTAAFTPRRASSVRNGTGSTSSASPPAPGRRSSPRARARSTASAATAPAATAGRSIAPSTWTARPRRLAGRAPRPGPRRGHLRDGAAAASGTAPSPGPAGSRPAGGDAFDAGERGSEQQRVGQRRSVAVRAADGIGEPAQLPAGARTALHPSAVAPVDGRRTRARGGGSRRTPDRRCRPSPRGSRRRWSNSDAACAASTQVRPGEKPAPTTIDTLCARATSRGRAGRGPRRRRRDRYHRDPCLRVAGARGERASSAVRRGVRPRRRRRAGDRFVWRGRLGFRTAERSHHCVEPCLVGVADDDALDLVRGRELSGRARTDRAHADDDDVQRGFNGARGRSARASRRPAEVHLRCPAPAGPPRPRLRSPAPSKPVGCSSSVGLAGIEPATSSLSGMRSNRLSYSPEAERQR